MINKLIIICFICLAYPVHSSNQNKLLIEAGKPKIQQAGHAAANELVLSVGVFDPLKEKLVFQNSKTTNKPSSYSIIQFHKDKLDPQSLKKMGIKIVSYMPNNAYVVKLGQNKKSSLTKNEQIRWVGEYIPDYKISPNLYNTENTKSFINLEVTLFSDYNKKYSAALIKKHLPLAQFSIPYDPSYSDSIILKVTKKDIDKTINSLALIDAVKWVNRYNFNTSFNTEAAPAVQANKNSNGQSVDDSYIPDNTPIWDKGITGSGQIVAVADSGLDTDEDWFVHYDNGQTVTHAVTESENTNLLPQPGTLYPDRKVIGYFTMPLAVAYDHQIYGFHGTHVTGSIAGDRRESISAGPIGSFSSPTSSGYDNDDGMAPNAQLLFQDCGGDTKTDDGHGELIAPIICFGENMFKQAYNAGARIHSNSYGAANNGYSTSDAESDSMLRKNEDMLILFAAGNDGPAVNTVGSSALGKSTMTVGALFHGNLNLVADFSSRGPTDDNRIKPDIMAPGIGIDSARGNEEHSTSINTTPLRATKSGTSMATPITAGSAALLRQYFTDGYYPTGNANPLDAHNPTGPLLKAALINGANPDVGHFDGKTGWGRVWLENSMPFANAEKNLRVWEITNKSGLKTNQEMEFIIEAKADQPIIATLTWYDVAGPLGSNKTLVNDLDLSIESNGVIYRGNNFTNGVTIEGGTSDTVNSVEQIRLNSHAQGRFVIKVSAPTVPGNGGANSDRQGFALVVSADFDNINNNPPVLNPVSSFSVEETSNFDNLLSWDDNTNADYFEIYRIEGTCDSIDQRQFRYIGRSEQTQFRDNDNLSAFRYAYKIRPAQFKELGPLSDCIDIESTRVCNDPPNFDQNTVVVANSTGDLCHVELQWQSVNSVCPSASGVRYNVYRSQENNFIPDSSNLIASTNLGATGFDDIFAPSGVPTFYIVTAEDNTTVGNGPNQGNESNGNKQVVATTLATSSTVGNLLEDIDNVALMSLNEPWQITNRRASDSILSYHSGPDVGNYPSNTCGRMISKSFELPANGNAPELSYQARYDFEQNWDGVVLEISTDNGVTWTDLPPNEGYPSSFSQTGTPPINICQYESTHGAFSGSSNGSFQTFTHDLSAFAGQSILLRWSISTDPNTEAEGFYIDNIQYKNINVPNACTVNTAAARPKPGFYFDRAKNGHGFVIEPIANTDLYFTIFYTYKEDGTPEWYTSQPTLENNVLNINSLTDPAAGALNRFIYDFNVDPTGAGNPNTLDDTVGESFLKVDFNEAVATAANACNDGFDRGDNQAVATWKIGDETGQWCVEPLANVIGNPLDPDFGGTWWAGIDDDGWGFSLAFTGDTIVVIIYYFDANGSPRWALGTQAGYQLGQEITLDMLEFAGFARDATAIELETVSTGALTLTINSRTGTGNDGNINLDINYQGIEGGNWNRTNVPITIFTEAH